MRDRGKHIRLSMVSKTLLVVLLVACMAFVSTTGIVFASGDDCPHASDSGSCSCGPNCEECAEEGCACACDGKCDCDQIEASSGGTGGRTGIVSDPANSESGTTTGEGSSGSADSGDNGSSVYYDESGEPIYPPNNGFVSGSESRKTLTVGLRIDRYGGSHGHYASPEGTSFEECSLPYTADDYKTSVYIIREPVEVTSGTIAPWFDEPGGGTQYLFDDYIDDLVVSGVLEDVLHAS